MADALFLSNTGHLSDMSVSIIFQHELLDLCSISVRSDLLSVTQIRLTDVYLVEG